MPSERILALDLSTKHFGWAFWGDGVRQSSVARPPPMPPNQPGIIYDTLDLWIARKLDQLHPAIVAIEQPHLRGVNSFYFCGMLGIVALNCHRRRIDWITPQARDIKLHATGKGNADKDAMVAAAEARWGVICRTDDEADALWLLDLVRTWADAGKI